MEIFRLFGSILVDNDEANKSISSTNDKAEGLGTKLLEGIKTAAKWGASLAAAAGTAALAVGTLAVNVSEDLHKALNGLQSSTGTSSEKMGGMRDAMLDIYNNNFGESFEDIGSAMQTIAQQTKQSGDELANTTKNALLMRDTFGVEVSESIKSVNQLMKNFGLSSDEAYNFMAQGAQNGLNANENLADSVNEYSVHFSQLGLSAEDMFNMFSNGAKSGVFDIDKLGDGIKEFGIRVKDGSTGTTQAFQSLGLDANKISSDFAKGGETGKKAFELVTSKLNEMKDPIAQNTTGTALFGTMWEDIGAKGIKALSDTKGGIDKNIDALGKINSVKYNTFGEAVVGIKRQLETGILIPIGEKILPILNDFATWFASNIPTIIQKFNDMSLGAIKFKDDVVALFITLEPFLAGIAAAAMTFGIYTLAINAVSIATGLWTTVTGVATIIGTAFGAVLAFITSPIGLVVIAIGLLIAAGVYLYTHWDLVKAKANELFTWLGSIFSPIFDTIKNTWNTAITTITIGLNTAFSYIKDKIIMPVYNWIKDTLGGIWDVVSGLFSTALALIWIVISTAFNAYKDKIIMPIYNWLKDTLGPIFDVVYAAFNIALEAIKIVISTAWNYIKDIIIMPVYNWLKDTFSLIFDTVKTALTTAWDGLTRIVSGIWDGIKLACSSVYNWLGDTLSPIFETVKTALKTAWDGLAGIVSGIWEGIKSNFKAGINTVIGFVNGFIQKINSIKINIPKVEVPGFGTQGGQSYGFNLPEIPQLATGTGYVPQDMLAEIHKGEMIVPKKYNPMNSNTGAGINITITGNTIMNDRDADLLGELLMSRLRTLGVN
jgi:phage-related minor tail protein